MMVKDQKVCLMAIRMLHAARDKILDFESAESRDELLEAIPVVVNVLESMQHLMLSHIAYGVVNLQNLYSKVVKGPLPKTTEDLTTAIDSDFKSRLKV
jgi:hypothetical protein